MPAFADSTVTRAAPENVWKVLYDPARFPEWWVGVATVRADAAAGVAMSCLVSDLRMEWRLEPAGEGTRISIEVMLPAEEAHRMDDQRDVISGLLAKLAQLACAS